MKKSRLLQFRSPIRLHRQHKEQILPNELQDWRKLHPDFLIVHIEHKCLFLRLPATDEGSDYARKIYYDKAQLQRLFDLCSEANHIRIMVGNIEIVTVERPPQNRSFSSRL